jgi:hypothetical protein
MNRKALLAKGFLVLIAEFAVFAALLFESAGTVLWLAGWVFMAIFFGVGWRSYSGWPAKIPNSW